MSVHPSFAALRLTVGMRSAVESLVVRFAHRLGFALTTAPIGRPDPVETFHWYAVWQGDALAE